MQLKERNSTPTQTKTMNRHDKVRQLARLVHAEKDHQQLNIALTHSSYYRREQPEKSNSRYVFTGMFAFKGEVAATMNRFVPGTGMQLQHALGNIFKNENLIRIYDTFGLESVIRYGNEFVLVKHTHIFVYAWLGFVFQHTPPEELSRFISRYILLPNYRLLDFSSKSKDLEAQCNVISRVLFGKTVKVITTKLNDRQCETRVSIDEYTIASETAGGYRYSRTKSLKKALKSLLDDAYFLESQNPEFLLRVYKIEELQDEKIKQKKEEKLRMQAEKEERKRKENMLKKQKRKEEKEQRDLARRKAKMAANQKKESRKGKNTIYRDYSAEEIAAMNAAKRRRLEDLGILPKSK